MFKEFAIDPNSIVNSFTDFKYVVEKFGMHQGRLIAEFPGKWKRMVYDAAAEKHTGTVELKRIETYLKLLKDHKNIFLSKGRRGDYADQKWIDTALQAHEQEPFDFIVCDENRDHASVVALNEFDETHDCLKPNRQWIIKREATAIATAVAIHTITAKKIKIIDPYFDLNSDRYQRPFQAILNNIGNSQKLIEIFCSDRNSHEHLVRGLDRYAEQANNRGVSIKLFILPQSNMHNRYFLTDRGGVMFATGLDDDNRGTGTSTDNVALLDPNICQAHWDEYEGHVAAAERLVK